MVSVSGPGAAVEGVLEHPGHPLSPGRQQWVPGSESQSESSICGQLAFHTVVEVVTVASWGFPELSSHIQGVSHFSRGWDWGLVVECLPSMPDPRFIPSSHTLTRGEGLLGLFLCSS